MKKYIVSILSLAFAISAFAVEKKKVEDVDVNALTAEVQKSVSASERQMNIVWLVPPEYWEISFAKQGQADRAALQDMVESVRPYFVIAVVQADITLMGTMNFYTEQEVAKGMTVTVTNSEGKPTVIKPLESSSQELDMLLEIMKPIFSGAGGNLGANFHFYVFSDIAESVGRNLDPYGRGGIEVRLLTSAGMPVSAQFETPFNSLFIPRICPNGKPAHVSWKYCPWTGKELPK